MEYRARKKSSKNKVYRVKSTLVSMVCFISFQAIFFANNIDQTLFLNAGQAYCVDGHQMAFMAFNSTSVFEQRNVQLSVEVGDTLSLSVINNDTIVHGFDIKGMIGLRDTILPGDTAQFIFSSSNLGLFIYYDHLNYPNHAYMGLSGIIAVGINEQSFFWNIKDHQSEWNDSLAYGGVVDWLDYYPDYFTINGRSNPNINGDTTARVVGGIGDTILIFMANTGQAEHSIHFHGYHCEILYSTISTSHIGRIKDTFPLKRMEGYVLRLVPDQVGEYPVHDHNLLSITGGGLYTFGMFITILIQ